MSERSKSNNRSVRSVKTSLVKTEVDHSIDSTHANDTKRRLSDGYDVTRKDHQRRSTTEHSQTPRFKNGSNQTHTSASNPHLNGRKKMYSPQTDDGVKNTDNYITSSVVAKRVSRKELTSNSQCKKPQSSYKIGLIDEDSNKDIDSSKVMNAKQRSRTELSSPSKNTKRRTSYENGSSVKQSKQQPGTDYRETMKTVKRPPFDNSTRITRNRNDFPTGDISVRDDFSNVGPDIEVQDWVVKELNLSNSKLTEKDLDRISVLVTVYCNVSINIKKVLAKYKEEDIFKQSKEEKGVVSKRTRQVSKGRNQDKESPAEKRDVRQKARQVETSEIEDVDTTISTSGQESSSTVTSNQELTKSEPTLNHDVRQNARETLDGDEKSETKVRDISEQLSTPSTQSEPVPSTSTHKTGSSKRYNDFQPIPGCSKDPDYPPRPRPKSDPSPGSTDHIIDPLQGTSKQADAQNGRKTPASEKPRRKVRLAPALPDMMNEPPRGVAISSIEEEEEEEEMPGKVKVDADMMEVALIILLANKRRKKELQALMASY